MSYPNGDTVGYAYDEYGRKTGVTDPEGGEAKYTYDSMDRLVKVEGADGESVEYSYDLLGRRIETAQENLTTTYAYDAMGNITGQQTRGESALSLAYAYDLNGQMIQEKRAENGGAVTSDYAYDKLGRLVDYSRSDGTTESYRYDAVGNMTQKTAGGQKASMRYNKANQLTEMRGNGGKLSYEYDANGNLTRKQMGDLTDTYTYDALDRLVGYSGHDGFEQQYTLNAQGLRASMEQQGNTNRRTLEEMLLGIELPEEGEPEADGWTKTEYIWDVTLPYGQLLTETTEGSTTSYLYGLERISATNESSRTQYVYDMRGSVAQTLTAQDGVTSAKSLSYTPFGSPLDEQSRVTGFGYNAEYYDAATGMLNLRARQYEPAMNRFGQKDILKGSAWLPQSLNRYAFVMNDPVGLADPSGMIFQNLLNTVKTVTKVVTTVVSAAKAAVRVASSIAKALKSDAGQNPMDAIKNEINSMFDGTDISHLSPEAQEQFSKYVNEYKDASLGTSKKSVLMNLLCKLLNPKEQKSPAEEVLQKNATDDDSGGGLPFLPFLPILPPLSLPSLSINGDGEGGIPSGGSGGGFQGGGSGGTNGGGGSRKFGDGTNYPSYPSNTVSSPYTPVPGVQGFQSSGSDGGTRGAGSSRSFNKIQPDPNASGDHSVFKTDPQGGVTNYRTYETNPNNPSGFQETKGYDGVGKPHTNKVTMRIKS